MFSEITLLEPEQLECLYSENTLPCPMITRTIDSYLIRCIKRNPHMSWHPEEAETSCAKSWREKKNRQKLKVWN